MKILNTTTGQIEELIHSGYDCDCVPDLIAADDTITWNEDEEIEQGSEESINWWRTYLAADAEAMEKIEEVKELIRKADYNAIEDANGNDHDPFEAFEQELMDAANCDMEDQPSAQMAVCEKWMASHT
jgi:hypothetical protein